MTENKQLNSDNVNSSVDVYTSPELVPNIFIIRSYTAEEIRWLSSEEFLGTDVTPRFGALNEAETVIRHSQIIVKSPEILQKSKVYNELFDTVLKEIQKNPHLQSLSYRINCFEHRDVELYDWKETVISIIIPELNFDIKIKLWKLIEESVQRKFKSIKDKKIQEFFKNLAIEIR